MIDARQTFLSGLLALIALMALGMAAPIAHAITDEEIARMGEEWNETTETARVSRAAQPPGAGRLIANVTMGLGVVLALMGAVAWGVRRFMPRAVGISRPGQPIEVLATRALGQRRSLLMVRAQGRTLLLGVTPQSIQMLTDLDEPLADWSGAADAVGMDEPRATAAHGTTSLENRGR